MPIRSIFPLFAALTLVAPGLARVANAAPTTAATSAMTSPIPLQTALDKAGDNRAQIEMALQKVPATQRAGMEFLIANAPAIDLQTLTAQFLLDHVARSYAAFNAAPWKNQIPQQIFFNDILPYASLNEKRENASALLIDKVRPIIAGAKTPGEAALRLNKQLFPAVGVKYSTARQRPDQCVSMSLESGLASCSGLSILLVNACRAAGVPARVVGTPLWSNGRGNHTWVEVYDAGDWHYIGAAEPDDQGYDHGWFEGDAANAKNDGLHAIYATSWKREGVNFPLVWDDKLDWVSARNVTARYARDSTLQPSLTRLQIRVVGADQKRVAAKVTLTDKADATKTFEGTATDESGDLNNFLTFEAPRAATYAMKVEYDGQTASSELKPADQIEQLITVEVPQTSAAQPAATGDTPRTIVPPVRVAVAPPTAVQPAAATREMTFTLPRYVAPPVTTPLAPKLAAQVEKSALDYFAATPAERAKFKFPGAVNKALRLNEPAVRAATWNAYKKSVAASLQADFAANQVRSGEYLSPYIIKTVGERPANGWPLFIAMHGGGGTRQGSQRFAVAGHGQTLLRSSRSRRL